MRKTFYFLTFVAVAAILALSVVAATRTDWLVSESDEVLHIKFIAYYGLRTLCERQIIRFPSPSDGGKFEYTDFNCRPFPQRVDDRCDKENRAMCVEWTGAGYASVVGMGFAAVALLALLFGVTTQSRRRRMWRDVAGLVFLHSLFQIVAFAIITDLFRTSAYPSFEYARFGVGYILNAISWILGLLVTMGVVITGISADQGSHWAAGKRGYEPIPG